MQASCLVASASILTGSTPIATCAWSQAAMFAQKNCSTARIIVVSYYSAFICGVLQYLRGLEQRTFNLQLVSLAIVLL